MFCMTMYDYVQVFTHNIITFLFRSILNINLLMLPMCTLYLSSKEPHRVASENMTWGLCPPCKYDEGGYVHLVNMMRGVMSTL